MGMREASRTKRSPQAPQQSGAGLVMSLLSSKFASKFLAGFTFEAASRASNLHVCCRCEFSNFLLSSRLVQMMRTQTQLLNIVHLGQTFSACRLSAVAEGIVSRLLSWVQG